MVPIYYRYYKTKASKLAATEHPVSQFWDLLHCERKRDVYLYCLAALYFAEDQIFSGSRQISLGATAHS